jgi:predicted transcriptional regulator
MNPEQTRKRIQNCNGSTKILLGSNTSILGVEDQITVRDKHRVKHVLTTGATGAGKSQELVHVALQDAYKGDGLAVINSKGNLVDEFLAKLPENRYDDLLYVNPLEEPITGINVLEPSVGASASTAEKANQVEIIVSNLIQLFKRRSSNWGDRFGRVLATLLRAGINANIDHQARYTLLDIKHCVTDTTQLKGLIDQTRDPELRSQLVNIKDRLSDKELEPLVRRLNDFTENPVVRQVIADETSDIDFQAVLNQQKILVLDVRIGAVGNTVAELLTSIVITKLWAAAQTRYNQNHDCSPFYLFVDELQTFPSEGPHFAEILSKAREYQLGCWLTTQYLSQLPKPMRDAVKNNCRTKLVFNPSGSEDLSKLARMLHGLDHDQLTRLGDFRAVIQQPGTQTRNQATIVDTYPPWTPDDSNLDQLKDKATVATETTLVQPPVLGKGVNAGKKEHTRLLSVARNELEERGFRVQLLHQNAGDDKPDGRVHLSTDEIAHLEAAHATLSKPAKVLKNLQRAHENGCESIFVVEDGNAERLENILSDPVNRNGNQHRDENGGFNYYTDSEGNLFTEIGQLDDARYRIMEVRDNGLILYEGQQGTDDTPTVKPEDTSVEELRDIDRTVLTCIKEGKDDIQKITSATGFPNHKVNYCFEKLDDLGLIRVEKPEKPVERVINGQKRVFEVKVAEPTPKANRLELG